MSALTDRIIAVLRQHYPVDNWTCRCTAKVRGMDDWAAHAAEFTNVSVDVADPTLLWLLRRAGDEWGPLGVAKAAARLAQHHVEPGTAVEAPQFPGTGLGPQG